MRIYVINLDRNPVRWQRMTELLSGLDFQRIAAVDGKNLDGPEYNDLSRPRSPETLSRYNRGCALSHRKVCQEFLAGADPYCCVLEDDVFISPDFARFVKDASWIPAGINVVKLETTGFEVFLSTRTVPCRNRDARLLRSAHLGTGAYIISRRGAQTLLDLTERLDRSIDRLMFEEHGLQKLHPAYQLVPALCIQASLKKDGMIFPEMTSTIQPPQPEIQPTPKAPVQNPVLDKIKREVTRPFKQLKKLIEFLILYLQGKQRFRVPFA